MTAGKAPVSRPAPRREEPVSRFYEHATAPWTNTDAVFVEALRAQYSQLHLTVVPQFGCDLVEWAAAGHAGLAPVDSEKDRLVWQRYVPPARRMYGNRGVLASQIKFAKYILDWNNREFVLFIVEGRDGNYPYGGTLNQYILSPSIESTNKLLLTSGQWNSELHNEVWVFDGGFWTKSAELYEAVQKASWDDVILDASMKAAIQNDVNTFFDSHENYERLRVPWKRGIIYHGPPGNGKTISIKAMMHSLYARAQPIPTLYVKSLKSFNGPEYSVMQIFERARREAPCYLVFEDLDSLVTDDVRSYFLNAVDGIQRNDGILMVGSTNHLDRLDPGIAKRPSRFDRKYRFANPVRAEREAYMRYWQRKLDDNDDVDFPDKICAATAEITNDFSFAYLQEAMIAALLAIARDKDAFSERLCLHCMEGHDDGSAPDSRSCDRDAKRAFKGLFDWVWEVRRLDEEDPDLDNYVLWRELKKQIRLLREELDNDKGTKRR